MIQKDIINEYFNWLCDVACQQRFAKPIPFKKLFTRLHDTDFIFLIPRDEDRAENGVSLRYQFAVNNGYEDYVHTVLEHLRGPCSVLEMMVALAIKMEETMEDPVRGDRTGQWFWIMIRNLGLGGMDDVRFDKKLVDGILNRFLNRAYDPDGKGGLFVIHNCDVDLRYVEIWYQMCWYLDTFV